MIELLLIVTVGITLTSFLLVAWTAWTVSLIRREVESPSGTSVSDEGWDEMGGVVTAEGDDAL